MIELRVRKADHCVAYEFGYHCIVGHSPQDDRRERLDREEGHQAEAPRDEYRACMREKSARTIEFHTVNSGYIVHRLAYTAFLPT